MGNTVLDLTLHLGVGLIKPIRLEHGVPAEISLSAWRIDDLAGCFSFKYFHFLSITCGYDRDLSELRGQS